MVFFNKIPLLGVNIFNFDGVSSVIVNFRTAIATWYYVLRAISTAILLIMLIYVGIRMAISSGITDKVVYKKMIVDWVVSMAIIYLLHYFMVFILYLNDAFVDVLTNLAGSDLNGDKVNDYTLGLLSKAASFELLGSSQGATNNLMAFMCLIIYLILFFQTIKFLLIYVKRMMTVSFLIIISPLITVTYSMDKMGDNKAQAFGMWLKEFLYNVFIQPFHCILYLVFANQAFSLVAADWGNDSISFGTAFGNGMLAILGILFINKGEEFIRNVFGFNKASSIESTAAAAVAVASVAKSAPKMAKTGKKMFNNKAQKMINSKLGKTAGKLGQSFRQGIAAGKAEEKADKSNNKGQTNDLNSNKDKYELEHKQKGLMGVANRAGRKLGKMTGARLKKLEQKQNEKMALKRIRKNHKDARHMTDDEIFENENYRQEFNDNLDDIEAKGGAAQIREDARKNKSRKVAKDAKDGKVKATGRVKFSETKIGKTAHSVMESKFGKKVSNSAKTAGHYVSKGANWVKDGVVLSAKQMPKKALVATAGLFSGIAAADATGDVIQTMTAAHAGYTGSKELILNNSSKTLNEERNGLMNKRKLIEDKPDGFEYDEVEAAMEKELILRNGQAGAYESKVLGEAENRVKKILSQIPRFAGDEKAAGDFINQLKLDVTFNGMSFNQALNKNLGGEKLSLQDQTNEAATEELRNLLKLQNDASLYNNMKTSIDIGKARPQVTGFTEAIAAQAMTRAVTSSLRSDKKTTERTVKTGEKEVDKAKSRIEEATKRAESEIDDKTQKLKAEIDSDDKQSQDE